jgi:hypothetical protein
VRKIAILLLIPCFVYADISLDQLHDAIHTLTESESEPYHVISDVEVYDYYSRTVGRHK